MVHSIVVAAAAVLLFAVSIVEAFNTPNCVVCKTRSISTCLSAQRDDSISSDDISITTTNCNSNRRIFLTNIAAGTTASSAVLFSNTYATLQILRELKRSGNTRKLNKKLVNFDQLNDLVELKKYRKLEKQYKK